jgi:hypothetical protein
MLRNEGYIVAKPTFVIRDPQGLDLRFYQSFDNSFLLNKAETLLFIAENYEKYKEFAAENGGGEEGIDKKFAETLRAEVHFTEFHQFEGFFALLIAMYQTLPHWLFLTTYETREIKEKVKALIEGDIKVVTNGQFDSVNDFLDLSVYAGFRSNAPEKAEKWKTNLGNIAWMLKRMAEKYDEAIEYNSYKHGLRVLTGHTYLRIHPSDNASGGFGFASDDSLRFLEVEKLEGQDTYRVVSEVFKHFNPIESINHIGFMSAILETIKSTRLASLKGETGANLNIFINMNKDELVKMRTVTKWSLTA